MHSPTHSLVLIKYPNLNLRRPDPEISPTNRYRANKWLERYRIDPKRKPDPELTRTAFQALVKSHVALLVTLLIANY